jgi:hypothetical protein
MVNETSTFAGRTPQINPVQVENGGPANPLGEPASPMSIGSVSFWQQDNNYWNQSQSFYQQDQNYFQQQQAVSQEQSADSSLFTAMGNAVTNATTGLAQIATQEAQERVNKEIAADEKELETLSGTGSTSSSTTPSGPAPATATGTVPLTASTTLASLGIPPGGTIAVAAGTNTTTYTSTGSDTIADLIGAINSNQPGNAFVTASLNAKGNLVITGTNQTENITIGGTFAPDIGFAHGNQSFSPTQGTTSSSTSSVSNASSSSSSSKSSKPTGTSTSKKSVTPVSQELAGAAASLLGDSGAAGSLVNMLV